MSGRLALVTPWFGADHTGGAERQAWQLASGLAGRGHRVEVLTTCSAGFAEDWGRNRLGAGRSREHGFTVHRFRVARRDGAAFDAANRRLLALPRERLVPGTSPVDPATSGAFVRENIRSPRLVRHLRREGRRYEAVLFLPYLYGTTLEGLPVVADRAFLQPCLHDEVYAYLDPVARLFSLARGLLFNSEGEMALAARLYGPELLVRSRVTGEGIEEEPTEMRSAPATREERTALARAGRCFALHLGRRDATKNTDLLLRAWRRFRRAHGDADLRLVLAGPGPAPEGADAPGVVDLGFVDAATKSRLLASCTALVQPSLNESFSRVVMEAWRHARPVVVNAACLATERSVRTCGGGLAAQTEAEWAEIFERLSDPSEDARRDLSERGRRGRAYAREAADWERALERCEDALLAAPAIRARGHRRPATRAAVRAVHQLLPSMAHGDAIGNHAIHLRGWLRQRGFRSEIYSRHLDPRLDHVASPVRPGCIPPDAGLVYHHSIGSELTPLAAAHQGPKLLVYHNVTPSRFFERFRPDLAALLREGAADLGKLAAAFPHSVADSEFNRRDLVREGFAAPGVLPVAVDPRVWRERADPDWMRSLQDGSVNLLFVGRIAPSKRQDHLLGAFAHVLRRIPRARLVIVGPEPPDDDYGFCLRVLARRLGVAPRVLFAGEVSQAKLHACYRSAQLYWSMSEHEGFGVPLVEAMWFDVPVLAHDAAAVAETLAGAGVLFREKRWPEQAVLVERLVGDRDLRAEVLAAQARRRRDFLPEVLEERTARLMEGVFGDGAGADS